MSSYIYNITISVQPDFFSPFAFATENLLQSSVDDSWTDSNLNRVSVIQFQEETKGEDEDDEAAAERRVSFHHVLLSASVACRACVSGFNLPPLVSGPSAKSNAASQ